MNCLSIIIAYFLCVSIPSNNSLSVDWAAFNYEKNISLVEIYYSCPYSILQYTVHSDTIIAPYQMAFYLKSIDGPDSLKETSNRRAIIQSFETAQRRDMRLLDGFGFFARPGRYWFNITLTESLPICTYTDTIEVPEFSRSPVLSNIELASSVKLDSSGGKFTKGNMRIVPNPELIFGQAYELIYAYIEGYNLTDDTLNYELTYKILSKEKSVVKSFPSEIKQKTGANFAYTFALSTKGLIPGEYFLQLVLKDQSSKNQDSIFKSFTVVKPNSESLYQQDYSQFTDTTSYYTEMKYLASQSELNQYNSLKESGKKEYLKRFWIQHDYNEFVKRIKYADEKYKSVHTLGRLSDRGKIYIKYGPPDEVAIHSMSENTKAHEHWYYYSKGFHFIFIDIRNNNTFPLIYSNNDIEPKNPDWQKYIDPLELEDLNE